MASPHGWQLEAIMRELGANFQTGDALSAFISAVNMGYCQNKVVVFDAAQYSAPVSSNIHYEHWTWPAVFGLRVFFCPAV
jgi:hypothetical protein